jgi:DNA polymerase-3 subunit delta
MSKPVPVIYLLHGEDEYAIAQFVSETEDRLGDAALAAMNVSRLDGRSFRMDDLLSMAGAMPFLAKRRIVVLANPIVQVNTPTARQKFLAQLEKIPSTTALLLVEPRSLTDEKDRKKGKLHWLERWAADHTDLVFMKNFPLPKGERLVSWIQERARAAGGQFTVQAAAALANLVGDDPRLADQEIGKLLAYANYSRSVEEDDVELLTADYGQGDIFTMVDALGNRDGRKAMGMLQRLLEHGDPFSIFGMVVRQFRLLLLAREVLDGGGGQADVAKALKIHPFVAEKVSAQARHFSLPVLESVYHRLLDMDEAIKTSQIEGDLALDTLVAALTN